MPQLSRSETNWTGTYDSNWTNILTGEIIEFRETHRGIEVWMQKANQYGRASRFSIHETRTEALANAHELADRFNTDTWFHY